MSDLVTAPRSELIALIYELIDKNQALEAEIAHLREQLKAKGKDNSSSEKPPDFVKANAKRKKKQVRNKREGTYHRFREEPQEQIFHSADSCSNCGGKLGKPTVAYSRQVIELPQVSYHVVEHVVFKRWCFNCKKQITPHVNLGKYTVGKGRIGLGLATTIAVMRDRLRLPLGVVKTYLKLFYSLKLSEGEIVNVLARSARIGNPRYNDLLATIRNSNVVHADETGGRENGRNGYFWSLSTDKVHFLLYRKSRSAKVVEEIVGADSEKFSGVLVTDFYASYNTYLGFHQRCWIHLLRDIDELKVKYKKHPPLNIWTKKVKDIYHEAKDWQGPPPDTPAGAAAQIRLNKQHYFEEKLKAVCQPYLSGESPMATLCGRAITFMPELFVFVRFESVPSSNNNAERILRHTVVARKISGGTRSEKGSLTKTILTSLFDTWKLQNLNPFQEFRSMLALYQ